MSRYTIVARAAGMVATTIPAFRVRPPAPLVDAGEPPIELVVRVLDGHGADVAEL